MADSTQIEAAAFLLLAAIGVWLAWWQWNRWRFTIRSLLLLTACVAIACAWLIHGFRGTTWSLSSLELSVKCFLGITSVFCWGLCIFVWPLVSSWILTSALLAFRKPKNIPRRSPHQTGPLTPRWRYVRRRSTPPAPSWIPHSVCVCIAWLVLLQLSTPVIFFFSFQYHLGPLPSSVTCHDGLSLQTTYFLTHLGLIAYLLTDQWRILAQTGWRPSLQNVGAALVMVHLITLITAELYSFL